MSNSSKINFSYKTFCVNQLKSKSSSNKLLFYYSYYQIVIYVYVYELKFYSKVFITYL